MTDELALCIVFEVAQRQAAERLRRAEKVADALVRHRDQLEQLLEEHRRICAVAELAARRLGREASKRSRGAA